MATIVSFVFFTALVGVLTWLITRKRDSSSSDGYFLAGRSLTAGVIAGSLLLTNLSTEQLVGLNGDAFRDGLCVMAWEVVAGASLVLMAIFFLPRYLAGGIATVPQFLATRYSESTRSITNAIFIVAYMLILLPIILYTGATALVDMLDVTTLLDLETRTAAVWVTVWLIGILGSIYAIFGGLRTVAVSDTLNGFGLLVGGFLITWFVLSAVNDGGAVSGLREIVDSHPEKFRSLGTKDTSVPWHTLFTGVLLLNLFYWTTNQQIIQRTFAATTLAEGQKGVLLAATFKIFAPLILVIPGMVAFHLDSKGQLFTEDRVAEIREGVMFDASLKGEVLKPEDVDKLVHKKKGDVSYGTLVAKYLPKQLTGFFAAVLVGAILSSFNSGLNATATLFSLGIFRRFIKPDATDQQTVASGKVFGTIIAIAAMCVAPLLLGQDSIFGYLQKMNGLYFIPIFAVVIVGMLTKHVPALAANLALVLGLVTISVGYFVPPVVKALEAVHGFHFLGIVFASLVALMLAIGAVSPKQQHEASDSQDADNEAASDGETSSAKTPAIDLTPWPLAKPVGIGLVIFIGLIYVYFAL